MIDDLYAPNQQLVRADGSGPAEEGDGGSTPEDPAPKAPDDGLDAMTKDELLTEAAERGVDANSSMTKAEIIAAIRAG